MIIILFSWIHLVCIFSPWLNPAFKIRLAHHLQLISNKNKWIGRHIWWKWNKIMMNINISQINQLSSEIKHSRKIKKQRQFIQCHNYFAWIDYNMIPMKQPHDLHHSIDIYTQHKLYWSFDTLMQNTNIKFNSSKGLWLRFSCNASIK